MTFLALQPSAAPALIDAASGETVSYRQLLSRAAGIGRAMDGDRELVFLLSHNDAFSTLVYAAALRHGHVIGLLDGSKPAANHREVLERYRPDRIAGPAGTAQALAAAGLDIGGVAALEGGELISWSTPGAAPMHPEVAVLLGTSGTTGSSKYVRLSTANVEANARSIAEYLQLDSQERPVTSLPLHYSFGLSVLNSHWLAGAAVVLTADSVIQRSFWQAVESRACTSLAGVPYTYQMLERIGYRDMDLPSMRTMQQAGGALDHKLVAAYGDHMREKGGRFFVMYGQTEATARIAYVPPDRLSHKIGSAGIAIPGGRLRTVRSEHSASDLRASGEVVYEGPNVMLGYAEGRDDLARGDEMGGVLHTGDIGYLDDEGFLFLTGRSKRIAKVFGLRINLDELELTLREHGPAAALAGDEAVWAFCAFGTDAQIAELRDRLSRRFKLHRSALELRRVPELPVSSSGKIDYRQVERWTRD